jgi:hypothetical protein
VRVGTGRRRQSADTDPARNDDSLHRRTRELEVPADFGDYGNAPSSASESSVRNRPM